LSVTGTRAVVPPKSTPKLEQSIHSCPPLPNAFVMMSTDLAFPEVRHGLPRYRSPPHPGRYSCMYALLHPTGIPASDAEFNSARDRSSGLGAQTADKSRDRAHDRHQGLELPFPAVGVCTCALEHGSGSETIKTWSAESGSTIVVLVSGTFVQLQQFNLLCHVRGWRRASRDLASLPSQCH
jgi:hypothetical protein